MKYPLIYVQGKELVPYQIPYGFLYGTGTPIYIFATSVRDSPESTD